MSTIVERLEADKAYQDLLVWIELELEVLKLFVLFLLEFWKSLTFEKYFRAKSTEYGG